MHNTSPK